MLKFSKLFRRYPRWMTSRRDHNFDLFNPTNEHKELRQMLRSFVETKVDPQALAYNREERFNVNLFKELGQLGLLGVTVDPDYGGSGMDATAAVIVHGTPFVF